VCFGFAAVATAVPRVGEDGATEPAASRTTTEREVVEVGFVQLSPTAVEVLFGRCDVDHRAGRSRR
jgi:hypothetical protein